MSGKTPKKKPLSKKQTTLVENLTKFDGNVSAAGKASGYNSRQAAHDAMGHIREKAPQALERLGIGRDRVFAKLGKLMEAKETKFFADKGIVMERVEVEALDIQTRATVELAKMHGAYPKGTDEPAHSVPGGITINLGVFDSPATAAFLASVSRQDRPAVLADALHQDGG